MNTLLLVLAILPVIVLAIYIYCKDRFEKEPLGKLLKAFAFGGLAILPAILLEIILGFVSLLFAGRPILSGAFNGYIVAGFSEELAKLLLLYLAVWKIKDFNEYFDGIVYAVFVSLGFACFENIQYVFFQQTIADAISTGFTRSIFAVPAHFLFGIVMGYYFALAKFQPLFRMRYLRLALLVPMLLHGTYDALLMIGENLGPYFPFLTVIFTIAFYAFDIMLWKIGITRLRNAQKLSASQACEGSQGNPDYKGHNPEPDANSESHADSGPSENTSPANPYEGINWKP